MELLQGLAGASTFQLLLIAAVGFAASFLGGVTGYGNSALIPLVLLPITGPDRWYRSSPSSGCSTTSPAYSPFGTSISAGWDRAGGIVPFCVFGAYVFTKLTGTTS